MTTSPHYHWMYCRRKFAQTSSHWQSSSQDFSMDPSTLAPIFDFFAQILALDYQDDKPESPLNLELMTTLFLTY